MEKASEDIIIAIILASIVTVILAVFTLLFFLVFVRKKRVLHKKKEQLSLNYEKALLQTKLEIQEQTLNNISREIHDNIGQVLSFVKLSLSTTAQLNDNAKQKKIDESVALIAEVISDLRDLSKSLSFEKIKKEGLFQVIKDEAGRLNRSGVIKARLTVKGVPFDLGMQNDLVLYRIFQEIVNNTLKHSESEVLIITLNYSPDLFTLTLRDKGKGFDANLISKSSGLGLENIRQRAALIGAMTDMSSGPALGCTSVVTLNLNEDNIYGNEKNIDSLSR